MLKQLMAATILVTMLGCGGGGSSDKTPVQPPVNNPPIAQADSIEVGMNVSSVLDVLANDSDKDAFSISSITTPANGKVINNTNEIVYTPNNGYTGSDSFSYTITDSVGQAATTTVTLTIINIPPSAENDNVATEQSSALNINVLANDTSVGGHELTITSTSVPSHGAVEHNGTDITYTPSTGFAGEDAFIYIVEDAFGDETTATVTITVNNVLPTTLDDQQTIAQNEAITVDVLANDSDALGDRLTIDSITGVAHGTAKIEANKIVYSPTPGYAGGETITYSAVDNYGASSQARLTITVNNVEPIAHDDTAYLQKDDSITIDVLANDDDVVDDTLTIQSVSAPEHGSVNIVDGKIVYQPSAGYIGDDLFGYTLIDSYGASDSGFVTVKVRNAIQLTGKVIGHGQDGLAIRLKVGELTSDITTDATGSFSADIDISKPSALVIAYIENAATNYHLRAYLGDVASLLQQADNNDGLVSNKNISDLTTAEYELIELVLAGNEATTAAELAAAQYDADNFYQLQMAITAQLINANNGLNLPTGYASVNEFMKSTTAMSQQLARWRDNNNSTYHQAFSALIADNELASLPERLTNGEHLLAESAAPWGSNHSVGYFTSLNVSGGASSYISSFDESLSATTSQLNNRFSVNFDTLSTRSIYHMVYCQYDDYSIGNYFSFNVGAFELTQIYSTPQYDVYLQKLETEKDFSNCQLDDPITYSTVRHYHVQPLDIASGSYHASKLIVTNEGEASESYSHAIANFTFNSDASFIDRNEQGDELTGTWANENNVLQLHYLDGSTLQYQKITDYFGGPQLVMSYQKNGQTKANGASYLIEPQAFTWPNSVGYLSYDLAPIFDPALNNAGRWFFQSDNTVTYQSLIDGTWQNDSYNIYGWSLAGNRYIMNRYVLDGEYVSFCDVSLENCYLHTHRELEIIGTQAGIYHVKTLFQRYSSDGQQTSNSSSVTKMTFAEL